MYEHCGGRVGWNGVQETDPRRFSRSNTIYNEVRIQKEFLTPLEVCRILCLFSDWDFEANKDWKFRVIDNNNYVTLRSCCPNYLFVNFVKTALSHILNGA